MNSIIYQQFILIGGSAKKHVCGCEGTVVGKGSHTIAFVRWFFNFILCFNIEQI